MDDLKSFTYVLAVAECKSISKAAELLYISQPSLSRFISSLEQELGILLFERKSNGINLTEAGEIYVAYGKEIKRLNSTMEHELKELQLSEEQEIHVCMSLNASLLLAMEVQEKISKKYIGCKVTFSNVMAKEILTGLKNRTYDLAIGPDLSEKDSSIVFDFIVEDYMLLAVPKKYMMLQKAEKREGEKYPWMDISMMPNEFIIQDNSCYIRQEINQIFEEYGKELKPKMIVNSSMLAMQTLEREMGFCFISEVFLPYITNTKDIDFFCIGKNKVKKTKTGIIYLKNKILSRQEKYCISVLKEKIRNGEIGA